MNKFKNITASGVVENGFGELHKILINSHTNGTMKLYDGVEGGAQAVSTLTSTGALAAGSHASATLTSTGAMVAGTHAVTVFTGTDNFQEGVKASGVLTSDQTQPTVGKVVVLGDITYTFRALYSAASNGATACNVPLGLSTAETMLNLYNAMKYNPLVDVVLTSPYVITVTAKSVGTAANSYTKTEDDAHLDWDGGDATLTGGVAADTITIGSIVYTAKAIPGAAYDFKIGVDLEASLVNLANAIGGESSYAGTVAHTQVVVAAYDATTITLRGRVPGLSLNAVATTETCAYASFPDTTLGGGTGASDAGVTTAAATATIDTTVYTVVDALSETYGASPVAYQVLKGANEAAMLSNLKKAINGTGTAGTEYSTGTVAHPKVVATTLAADSLIIRARVPGTSYNGIATTETMANTAWGGATLGGAGNTAGIATTTATITIGTRTYTFVTELSETLGAAPIADQIYYVTSVAVALDNMKLAINGTGIAGTNYSTGTTPNTQVEATTNANDSQIIQARVAGTSGNSIATVSTIVNHAWTSTVMASGTGSDATPITGTITFAAGPQEFEFDLSFSKGLYITFAATVVDATVIYK